MNIDHRTLNDCLNNGSLYLGQFILSLEIITEMQSYSESILSLIKFKELINLVRDRYKIINQSNRKTFIALNVINPSSTLCGTYNSIN
jgi:hypothetical protein